MGSSYVVHERNRALTASTAKSLCALLAPSTRRLAIVEIGISFDGVTATDPPVDVDLLRVTTAGTMTDFGTEIPADPAMAASVATATVNATAEPTAGDILGSWQVTPNGGLLVVQWLPDDEFVVGASGRIALRATPGSAITANATAYIRWREFA